MNKNMIKIACLFVSGFAGLQGMQQVQQAEDAKTSAAQEQKFQVIEGDIYLVGDMPLGNKNQPFYCGYKQSVPRSRNIVNENGESIQFRPDDVLINVCATSASFKDWSVQSPKELNNRFPFYLPLSFLEGKNDGDTISFLFKNEVCKIFKIQLTCKQLLSPYSSSTSFQNMLRSIKEYFYKNPSCFCIDEGHLIRDGILITTFIGTKTPHGKRVWKETLEHGSNGFSLEKKADGVEKKQAATEQELTDIEQEHAEAVLTKLNQLDI